MRSSILPGLMFGTIAFTGCATTSGSTAGGFGGIVSNFQSSHKSLNGNTFYSTLSMEDVSASHNDFQSDDLTRLALTANPQEARGFIAVAHDEIYEQTAFKYNLVTEAEILQPLNAIKLDLLRAWDGPAPDIAILVSSEPGYHGKAFPKNFIVLPMGALVAVADQREEINGQPNAVGTEDELAALIAHEMSHILLGHYNRGERFLERDKLNNVASGISMVGIVVAGARVTGSGENMQVELKNEERSASLVETAFVAHALFKEGNALLTASTQREQEDHADMLAADLLVKAGYDPTQMKAFLERSQQAERQAAETLDDLSDTQKILAAKIADETGGGQGNLFSDMVTSFSLSLFNDFLNKASATHRSTAKRADNMKGYVEAITERVYAVSEDESASLSVDEQAWLDFQETQSTRAGENLEALRNGASGNMLNAYRLAFEAEKILLTAVNTDLEKVAELIVQALQLAPNDPGILLIASRYYMKHGNYPAAVRVLEIAVEQDGSGPLNFTDLAGAYLANNQPEKALEAIERGEKETGATLPFVAMRIGYHASLGEWAEATEANAICQKSDADALKQKCSEAMVPVDAYYARQAEMEKLRKEQERANQPANPFTGIFGGG